METESGNTNNQVILHDRAASKWLHFKNPHSVVTVHTLEDVLPALQHLEEAVRTRGWYAAGFISYEASRAFDAALGGKAAQHFPLLWFGLYPRPDSIVLPDPDYSKFSIGERIATVGENEYRADISQIKKHIQCGDTYQVNYTLHFRMEFTGDPWHLFLAMLRAQSPGYSAWIDTGRYAVCSASPELFFSLQGNRLTCKPMKGTVKRGRTLSEDGSLAAWLQHSEKNRAENLMIVDMVRNDMGRIADTGTVEVTKLFEVERHPTLWQMTSTVQARTSRTMADIFRAIFPCASITGAPKIRTSHIIADLEKAPRNLYTGCIGFLEPGLRAQFNVAIRTAVVDSITGIAEYGTGGGIVWDSSSGEEYVEAILKSKVLDEKIPDFALLETLLWNPGEEFFLLQYHLNRMADSAAYFGFPFKKESVLDALRTGSRSFPGERRKVRLLLYSNGTIDVQSTRIEEIDSARTARVALAKEPVNSENRFLYHKTTARELYERARKDYPDCDDVLLWNERGELTESSISNIVLDIGGELCTPPVSSGLLPGVFRASLLEKGQIRERVLQTGDLKTCRKIYLINSVRKWREAILAREV